MSCWVKGYLTLAFCPISALSSAESLSLYRLTAALIGGKTCSLRMTSNLALLYSSEFCTSSSAGENPAVVFRLFAGFSTSTAMLRFSSPRDILPDGMTPPPCGPGILICGAAEALDGLRFMLFAGRGPSAKFRSPFSSKGCPPLTRCTGLLLGAAGI